MSAAAMTSSPMISPHFLEALVGREHGGGALVATAHELEEEHGAGLVDGQVAEPIDDEKRGVAENGEPVVSKNTNALKILAPPWPGRKHRH